MGYPISRLKFDDMLKQSGWSKACGPYPGVWRDDLKPRGERCLWSCIWWAEDGRIEPLDIAPPGKAAMLHELKDIADRGDREAVELLDSGGGGERRLAEFIRKARDQYVEYSWPGTPAYLELRWKRWRQGWGLEEPKAQPAPAMEAVEAAEPVSRNDG